MPFHNHQTSQTSIRKIVPINLSRDPFAFSDAGRSDAVPLIHGDTARYSPNTPEAFNKMQDDSEVSR